MGPNHILRFTRSDDTDAFVLVQIMLDARLFPLFARHLLVLDACQRQIVQRARQLPRHGLHECLGVDFEFSQPTRLPEYRRKGMPRQLRFLLKI